jgi:serine/threonine protein kinase
MSWLNAVCLEEIIAQSDETRVYRGKIDAKLHCSADNCCFESQSSSGKEGRSTDNNNAAAVAVAVKVVLSPLYDADREIEVLLAAATNNSECNPLHWTESDKLLRLLAVTYSHPVHPQQFAFALPLYDHNLAQWCASFPKTQLSAFSIRSVCKQLCESMLALHHLGYLHLDIRPENCFISRRNRQCTITNDDDPAKQLLAVANGDQWKAILGDYGLCQPIGFIAAAKSKYNANVAPAYAENYRATELADHYDQHHPYIANQQRSSDAATTEALSTRTDVWALGKTFFTCFRDVISTDSTFADLIQRMTCTRAEDRLYGNALITHRWFGGAGAK